MATAKKIGAVKNTAEKTSKRKVGRPTKFTVKLVNKICERISGGESLRNICRDEKMPDRANIHRWLLKGSIQVVDGQEPNDYQNFRDQYDEAMDMRADLMFEELEDIADDGQNDFMTKYDRYGNNYEGVDSEHIQRSRLRVDTRKWILARMKPKKYNDKFVHVTEDEDGNQIPISGNVIQFAPQNDNESES